jgi:Cu(I)/Ag(I) efflux system membrane fusion protein/cobalt-zinc-cadmium efflux system membrane fusion protein
MNSPENTSRLRGALRLAIAGNAVLAIALSALWWHWRQVGFQASKKPSTTQQIPSSSPRSESGSAPKAQSSSELNEPQIGPVQLTPQKLQSIGVKLDRVQMKSLSEEIRVTGNVEVDERRLSIVQVRFPGWIRKVFVDATYDYVRKGQPLFTIYSPDLVTTEREYLLARKNQQDLSHSSIDGVSTGAETLVAAARERLQQWDVPQSEIEKVEASGKVITDLAINSPVSGFVTERNALANMYVQPETKLYAVADFSTVWVYAQVFQTDIGRLKIGDSAVVTVDAYPQRSFKGHVDFILPQVDINTRTVRVRLAFPNPGLLLKPGMYVNVALKTDTQRALVIPGSAVFHSGTRSLVFVSEGGGSLAPREVDLGRQIGDEYVVRSGLRAGESIVTSANFLIDSEAQLQAAAGAFVPPPPGAGGAAAMAVSSGTSQANVEFTTEPSPPAKGNNTIRVKLTDAKGSPISGAQLHARFYMAAMPAMGMAAMKTDVNLSDKGDGLYEGKADLASGGTWQATITARKDGNMIANKQVSVNATGGM